ncbi:hypothetical protein ABPG75_010572 [Micractinium tetrahymenae]
MGACLSQQQGRKGSAAAAAAAWPDWGRLPEELLVSCLANLSLEERQRTAAQVCRGWRHVCFDSTVLLRQVEVTVDGCCDWHAAADDTPATWRGCGLVHTISELAAAFRTRKRGAQLLRRLRSLHAWLPRAAPSIRHARLCIRLPLRLDAARRLEAAALIVQVLTALGSRSTGSTLQSVTLDLFSGPCHTLHLRAIRPQDGGAPLAPLLGLH